MKNETRYINRKDREVNGKTYPSYYYTVKNKDKNTGEEKGKTYVGVKFTKACLEKLGINPVPNGTKLEILDWSEDVESFKTKDGTTVNRLFKWIREANIMEAGKDDTPVPTSAPAPADSFEEAEEDIPF